MLNPDIQVRLSAFAYLEQQLAVYGEAVPRSVLAEGYCPSVGRTDSGRAAGVNQPHEQCPVVAVFSEILSGKFRLFTAHPSNLLLSGGYSRADSDGVTRRIEESMIE